MFSSMKWKLKMNFCIRCLKEIQVFKQSKQKPKNYVKKNEIFFTKVTCVKKFLETMHHDFIVLNILLCQS